MTTWCYSTKLTYADNAKCLAGTPLTSTETSFYLINTTTAVCVMTGSTSLKATACTATAITANTFTDTACSAGSAAANVSA